MENERPRPVRICKCLIAPRRVETGEIPRKKRALPLSSGKQIPSSGPTETPAPSADNRRCFATENTEPVRFMPANMKFEEKRHLSTG